MNFLVRFLIFLALQEGTNRISHTKLSSSFIFQADQICLPLRVHPLEMERDISPSLPPQAGKGTRLLNCHSETLYWVLCTGSPIRIILWGRLSFCHFGEQVQRDYVWSHPCSEGGSTSKVQSHTAPPQPADQKWRQGRLILSSPPLQKSVCFYSKIMCFHKSIRAIHTDSSENTDKNKGGKPKTAQLRLKHWWISNRFMYTQFSNCFLFIEQIDVYRVPTTHHSLP